MEKPSRDMPMSIDDEAKKLQAKAQQLYEASKNEPAPHCSCGKVAERRLPSMPWWCQNCNKPLMTDKQRDNFNKMVEG